MIILRHTTLGRTPLDEGSARYLTTHNTLKTQAYAPVAGFEPATPNNQAAPGIGTHITLTNSTDCGLLEILGLYTEL